MDVRFARHTNALADIVAFYRGVIGLELIGGFTDHEGYDGVFFDLPGSGAHLEFTAGGSRTTPTPHPETLLVLYLGSQEAVDLVVARSPAEPVAAENPYWQREATTLLDPDGFGVVLVPRSWAP